MSERHVWLDPDLPEAAVVDVLVEAGWIRELDQPGTQLLSRHLVFTHPGTRARIVHDAFVAKGCHTVTLLGDPDAIAARAWARVEALPRYEAHAEDAVSGDPARSLRGLRQWTVDVLFGGPGREALTAALARARGHDDEVLRVAAAELERLLAEPARA
jgi:hypothetical protein